MHRGRFCQLLQYYTKSCLGRGLSCSINILHPDGQIATGMIWWWCHPLPFLGMMILNYCQNINIPLNYKKPFYFFKSRLTEWRGWRIPLTWCLTTQTWRFLKMTKKKKTKSTNGWIDQQKNIYIYIFRYLVGLKVWVAWRYSHQCRVTTDCSVVPWLGWRLGSQSREHTMAGTCGRAGGRG